MSKMHLINVCYRCISDADAEDLCIMTTESSNADVAILYTRTDCCYPVFDCLCIYNDFSIYVYVTRFI